MKYWLIKSEPETYSWNDFLRQAPDHWDGVRNYQARNNLRAMKTGDQALFYHSVTDKAVVGIAEVCRESYQDPTTDDDRWVAVDLRPLESFRRPVSLAEIKANAKLAKIALLKQSRLSVVPLTALEFRTIAKLGRSEAK